MIIDLVRLDLLKNIFIHLYSFIYALCIYTCFLTCCIIWPLLTSQKHLSIFYYPSHDAELSFYCPAWIGLYGFFNADELCVCMGVCRCVCVCIEDFVGLLLKLHARIWLDAKLVCILLHVYSLDADVCICLYHYVYQICGELCSFCKVHSSLLIMWLSIAQLLILHSQVRWQTWLLLRLVLVDTVST